MVTNLIHTSYTLGDNEIVHVGGLLECGDGPWIDPGVHKYKSKFDTD